MTPREILEAAFDRTVSPRLGTHGFRKHGSRFAYKREVGEFIQWISINLSRGNTAESMRFGSAFNVESPAYDQWLKSREREPLAGYLGGSMDWNIPGWGSRGETSYDFTRVLTRRLVIRRWLRRCQRVGIPYLDRLSTWQGAARDLLRYEWHWHRAADFYEIAGDPKMAIVALEQGVAILRARDYSAPEGADAVLAAKRQRLAEKRDAEMEALENRIHQMRSRPWSGPE